MSRRLISLQALAGVVVSAVCLVVAFRHVELSSFTAALRTADYRWLLWYPVLCVALNLVRGEVWRLLLKRKCGLAPAFWAYTVGFLFNNILPLRVGEAARIVVLARHERLPIAEVAATAILERLLDLAAVLLVLVCTLPVVGLGEGALSYGAMLALVVIVGVVGAIYAASRWRDQLEKPIGRLSALGGPAVNESVIRRWREAVDGVSRLLKPRIGVPAALGILFVWAMSVAAQWTVLLAFQPRATAVEGAFMVAVVSLAIAVPAAPGFIGVYQWAGQQALVHAFPVSYTPASGLAIAVAAHAISYLCSTLLGVVGLWYFGVSLSLGSELRRKASLGEAETA
ncbi:MAG TPA: lysylphosphatidylglycerol synthase transmembrane domain-containing protein [Vicinamibacterales bacterium]|nr:lysylphosphatidylglycerol synthase transmembrane domain-containing protein [Vicinamibacterales bacterium]